MASLDTIARRFNALRAARDTVAREKVAEARELCRGELVEASQHCTEEREEVRAGCRDREAATREKVAERFRPRVQRLMQEQRKAKREEAPPTRRARGWTWRASWEHEIPFREGRTVAVEQGLLDWFEDEDRGRAMYATWRATSAAEKKRLPFHDLVSNALADAGADTSDDARRSEKFISEAASVAADRAERRGSKAIREHAAQERAAWLIVAREARAALRSRWRSLADALEAVSHAMSELQHAPTTSGRVVTCSRCQRAGEVVRAPRAFVFAHPPALERLCRGSRARIEHDAAELDDDDTEVSFP